MARPIVVSFQGCESRFDFTKLERKKLYGSRRRVPLDANEEPCKRASLTDDGRHLLRSGMTAQGYFTEVGTWIPNKALQGIDASGAPVEKQGSTLGVAQTLEPCQPQDLVDHHLTTIYYLEAQDLDDGLREALEAGSLFRFRFNYRADFRAEVGFLLQNEEGVFALIGIPAPGEWLEPTAAPPMLDDDDDDDGDLDFEMF